MSTFEELMGKQEQSMGSISRAITNFKKLSLAKWTPAIIRQRLVTLNETFAKCQELHSKLILSADEKTKTSHEYFTEDQFLSCEDTYYEASDLLAETISQLEGQSIQPGASHEVSGFNTTLRSSSYLPRINLPTFDGNFAQWETFRDRFKSMISEDKSLSDVERMHYLCSCLKGDASNALNHLAVTNDNFKIAWDILVSRYDNKRRLITIHLQSLLNLPVMNSETSSELRNLRDQANAAIQALKNLDRPVKHWDDFLVFIIAQKLDNSSRKAWELTLGDTVEYPTYLELDRFLESPIHVFDAIVTCDVNAKPMETTKRKTVAAHKAWTTPLSCPLCKTEHLLYQCAMFLKQTPSQRFDFIRKNRRCLNCFSIKHNVKDCTSSRACKQCNKRHHTLLHLENSPQAKLNTQTHPSPAESAEHNENVAAHLLAKAVSTTCKILLATARIRVYSPLGRYVTVRALLDQGSMATMITESLAQCLRLSRVQRHISVTGIGETQSVVRYATTVTITPASSDGPAYSTSALVLKTLTKYMPQHVSHADNWNHIAGLNLADNKLMSTDPIDVIIGADLFGMLLLDGVRKGSEREPIAQNTTLGWIISGPMEQSPIRPITSMSAHHGVIYENLDRSLRRFWEVEEIPLRSYPSPEDLQCEEHFVATHSRTPQGRYVVRLPFKTKPPIPLGESKATALTSLRRMEQRIERDPANAKEYREFLTEYEHLGHMEKVLNPENANIKTYYMPHHAVLRNNSPTTRLRVVFNASCKTTNGTSLNDHMLIGPKLQKDLASVILQWRQYRYVYSADIAQMYRQILVDTRDTDYQRILWRSRPSAPVTEYRLLTVTYGTAAAPYLALRVLKQLAYDEGDQLPLAVSVLDDQTYVDDCVFGADDQILARQTRDQLITLLKKGGFQLRKWASNSPSLLTDLDSRAEKFISHKILKEDDHLKILGIEWNPVLDAFQFKIVLTPSLPTTKRAILSVIAKFFDPLGWATPVLITAKIFLQQLWALKCQWDDDIPEPDLDLWRDYFKRLPRLGTIRIPRWTTQGPHSNQSSLHGFSDASLNAFAAVVYLRTAHVDGTVTTSLLAAKSKVAPLKTISIPRLELSAAHLLARLMRFVRDSLHAPEIECYCFTDSTITLAWLKQPPAR